MPYQRRRRASLAVTPVRTESLDVDVDGNDRSSSTDSTDHSSVCSDASYFEADIGKYGRIPEILMVDLWSNDAVIVFESLRELADIGSVDGEEDLDSGIDDRAWIFELGGPSCLVSVLKKWHRYRKITIEGLRAIANLGANSDFRDAIFTFGGVEVTLAAMRNFKVDQYVQRNACACIQRFCVDKKQNCVELVRVWDVMKLLVRAMKRFQMNTKLQKLAIDLLYDFCSLEQLRFPIVGSGCLAPLNAAIDRFGESKDDDPVHTEIWEKARIIIDRVIE